MNAVEEPSPGMERALRALRALMFLATAGGILLTFAWPFLVSSDPADASLRVLAQSALMTFLSALAGLIVLRAWRRGDRNPRQE